ncbi:hypothetical protein N8I77_001134 [Diaporthe amygdali]|uniref:Glucose-methanol-choline oxidoreductase N-terminal domain-containing protein n=1 Tax=Phomopsis amygdali TaxID=1214568 RepID=A0AAD9SQ10_PHOAM|nr:hypothetical protein N8I77_001134 [Diaporthe amygdali]KAK2614291.1 hypothetical protein N8I77_001134 [Diaporthe amygdali]
MVPRLWASAITLASSFYLSSCLHIPPNAINGSLRCQYDYIVVGGGASGLVVANRLSEDPDVTVLVLEVGTLDTGGAKVTIPAEIGDTLWTDYDWKLQTVQQEYLENRNVVLNQGRVVGGGTILNGMVWTRGSARDYDAWGGLNAVKGQTNGYNWRWKDLLPYFQKSENFTADVDVAVQSELHIHPNTEYHGEDGPVSVAFPRFFYNQSSNFLAGMTEMGLPIVSEPNDGTCVGAMANPSSLNAHNQSRCDSRTAYLDPVIDRLNLHIATEQMVTRVLLEEVDNPNPGIGEPSFSQLQKAVGVEFARSQSSLKTNVTCSREIILAAGAIFSPTLLQISGIGPEDVLRSLNIPVRANVPGVGANFQDHGMLHPVYSYTNVSLITARTVEASSASYAAAQNEYETNRTGPLTAPMISTIAFPAMRHFADDWVELIDAADQRDINQTLPPDTPASVREGYIAQRKYQVPLLRNPTEGAVEILGDSIGTLSVAMQRPLSRGTVRPKSQDIFDLPLVDPRYCSEPFDCLVLARALLFNCALINTHAMAELQPVVQEPYFCPNLSDSSNFDRNVTDSRMLDLAKQYLATEFHPSGSTAMLPFDLGGVVDTRLRVYGTEGLRVVDAGVMPMVLGAHLQAAVYAIAERAADIISDADVSGGVDPDEPGCPGVG